MPAQIANALSAKVLMTLGAVVLALFVISGVIASKYGQHAEGTAGAIGAVTWFGFLIGALVLVVLSIVALASRAVASRAS